MPLDRIGTLAAQGLAIEALAARVTLKQLSGTEPGATGSVRIVNASEVSGISAGPGWLEVVLSWPRRFVAFAGNRTRPGDAADGLPG